MKWSVIAAGALFSAAAFAQAPSDPAAEMKAAFAAAKAVAKEGPSDVKLLDQAMLHLPEGFVFVPKNESMRILKAMGNRPAPDTLGLLSACTGHPCSS